MYTASGCGPQSSCDCGNVAYTSTMALYGGATDDKFGAEVATTDDVIAVSAQEGTLGDSTPGDVHMYMKDGREVFRVDTDSDDKGHFGHIVQLSEDAQVMAVADPYMNNGDGQVRVLHVDNCITLTSCPKGHYARENRTDCQPCPPGSYQNARGKDTCEPCPFGSFAQGLANHRCQPCQYTDGVRCLESPDAISIRTFGTRAIPQDKFADAISSCLAEHVHGDCPIYGLESEYDVMSAWNTILITDMSNAFKGRTQFNGDIRGWDTSSVTNMASMFEGARSFQQSLASWDTYNVVNVGRMFYIPGWRYRWFPWWHIKQSVKNHLIGNRPMTLGLLPLDFWTGVYYDVRKDPIQVRIFACPQMFYGWSSLPGRCYPRW